MTRPNTRRWKELQRQLRPWDPHGPALTEWLGELHYGGVYVDGFHRGLPFVHVMDSDPKEVDETPEFWAAVRQGWVGAVDFIDGCGVFEDLARGGWPSLRPTPYITAFGQYYTTDDLLRGPLTLVNLREFTLDDDRWGEEPLLTDAGLARFRKHQNLQRLKAYGRFTRKGVARLASAPRLRYLKLGGVEGDLDALTAELREKLPGCQITLYGP